MGEAGRTGRSGESEGGSSPVTAGSFMLTVYVIRHGETEANRNGVFQGHMDVPLSKKGHMQADRVAEALRDVRFDAVYSSDLSRAYETARAIMRYHDCSLLRDKRLREINGGKLQGLNDKETAEQFPEFHKSFIERRYTVRRPGGESYADLDLRVQRAMEDFLSWNQDKPDATIGVVSHGGAIRSILKLAEPDPEFSRPVVGNCSITVLQHDGAGWKLLKVSDCDHLAGFEG
ncbi:MAG: histidine phosphatase family protein [Bacillota bacterium]